MLIIRELRYEFCNEKGDTVCEVSILEIFLRFDCDFLPKDLNFALLNCPIV